MLENENMIDFIGSLKEMSSEQLSRLIQEETAKECPNDELVLMALGILENREKEKPVVLGPKGKTAWKKYQLKVRARDRKTALIWKPLMQVASVVLVITLLFALLPTKANAETWWERLARWTEDFFSFFNPNESVVQDDEYVFQTDNEGLQQIYDILVDWGISDPIVPMWIPTDYLFGDIKVINNPDQRIILASFGNGESELIFQISLKDIDIPYRYCKEDGPIFTYEKYGTTYNIFNNNDNKTVVWAKDKLECAFSVDCQEEILYEIIESIYRWG